jgi:hypothetical protein
VLQKELQYLFHCVGVSQCSENVLSPPHLRVGQRGKHKGTILSLILQIDIYRCSFGFGLGFVAELLTLPLAVFLPASDDEAQMLLPALLNSVRIHLGFLFAFTSVLLG